MQLEWIVGTVVDARHLIKHRAPLVVVAAALVIAALAAHQSVSASPGHDAFADALAASLPYQYTLDSANATIEQQEPQPCVESTRTVWYRFTAVTNSVYEVDTFGSDFDTAIAVYTGTSLQSLSLVGCNDDTLSSVRSRVQFSAIAGVTYHIQAGGWRDLSGILTVNIRQSPPPPANDAFAQAVRLVNVPFGDARFNSSATEDFGERNTTCSDVEKTIWYEFTPPASGFYAIDTAGSDFDTVLTVYTGTSLDTLIQVACNDDIGGGVVQSHVEIFMLTNATYRIQAGGFSGWRGGAGADFGRLVLSISVPLPGDSDGDGCADDYEMASDARLGGDRSPHFFWDFYDVTGDGLVDFEDTLSILAHFGHAAGRDATDGLLDRVSPDPSKPWRAAPPLAPSDGISFTDALSNMASFGHSCPALLAPTSTPGTASPTPFSTPLATSTPAWPSCVDTDLDELCDDIDPDDDNDLCPDTRELGSSASTGGLRDPLNYWDFYDVTGDGQIDFEDSFDILSYFGDRTGVVPGALRDRYIPDQSAPWRTAKSNTGVDFSDVLINLKSFGHNCR